MTYFSILRSILFIVVILAIGIVGYQSYTYQKYNNISRLDYLPGDSIDYSYYDPAVLSIYLANCDKLSQIARKAWVEDNVDVRRATKGYGRAQSDINQYNALLRYTKVIESRLVDSKNLKNQGLTNDVIEQILDKGITVGAVQNEKDKMDAYEFLKGKNVSARSNATEIWELQKLLNENDYNLNINGVFDARTDSSLLDFQKSNNLYPSHICDDITLKKLTED